MGTGASKEESIKKEQKKQDEEALKGVKIFNYVETKKEKESKVPRPRELMQAQLKFASYKPEPLMDEDGLPKPQAPIKFKDEIFKKEEYEAIDNHATNAPQSLLDGSFQELVDYLTRICETEMEKVRVIFRWVAAQSLGPIKRDTPTRENSPLDYLKNCKFYFKDFYELMKELYDTAGIPCKVIRGRLKAAQYHTGLESTLVTNAWNAVLVDNEWRLINARWATMAVKHADRPASPEEFNRKTRQAGQSQGQEEKAFYGRCDESYFLAEPTMLIYSHFPDEPRWQLLAKPVRLDQFFEMAHLRAEFFEQELDLVSSPEEVLVASYGEVTCTLATQPGARKSFNYKMTMREGELEKKFRNVPLNDFVLVEQKDVSDAVNFEVRLPGKGHFVLHVYCKDRSGNSTSEGYAHVMTYLIKCYSAKIDCLPFPKNEGCEWGPGHELALAKVTPVTGKTARIDVDEGIVDVRFKLEAGGPREFSHSLEHAEIPGKDLKPYTCFDVEEDEAIFHVRLPRGGEYSLNVHAKDKTGMKFVCCYLINAKTSALVPNPFPTIPGQRAGFTQLAHDIGLKRLDHKFSFFRVAKGANLHFSTNFLCEFSWNLMLQLKKSQEDMNTYCIMELPAALEVKFRFRFPKPGCYLWTLKAVVKEGPFAAGGERTLANYVFDVYEPDIGVNPFPRCYPDFFKNGFKLDSPDGMYLKPNQVNDFVLGEPNDKVKQMYYQKANVHPHDDEKYDAEDMEKRGQKFGLERDTGHPGKVALTMRKKAMVPLIEWEVMTKGKQAKRDREAQEVRDYLAALRAGLKQQRSDLNNRDAERLALMKDQEQLDRDRKSEDDRQMARKEIDAQQKYDRMLQNTKQRRAAMKQKLKRALQREDRPTMIQLLQEYKNLFGEEAMSYEEVVEAQTFINFVDCRDGLEKARNGGHYTTLVIAIEAVEQRGFSQQLAVELEDAKKRAEQLRAIHELGARILKLEPRTLFELKKYEKPPKAVHTSIRAAMLLLGECEESTGTWDQCKKFVHPYGRYSLITKIRNYDRSLLEPEIWARTKELLGPVEQEGHTKFSAAVTAIFRWAAGITKSAENEFMRINPKPANIKRQKELFEKLFAQRTMLPVDVDEGYDGSADSGEDGGAATERGSKPKANGKARGSKTSRV